MANASIILVQLIDGVRDDVKPGAYEAYLVEFAVGRSEYMHPIPRIRTHPFWKNNTVS